MKGTKITRITFFTIFALLLSATLLQAQTWTEHTLNGSYTRASSVYAVDLDGDGDMDILGTSYGLDDITWWENDGSENFTQWTIDYNVDGAYDVYAADIDGDGDLDVVGVSYVDDFTAWWKNDGTPNNNNWTKYQIDNADHNGASSVYAADMDGDGDMDVLSTAALASVNDITWWENNGTPEDNKWPQHSLSSTFNGARSVFAIDLDGDGDMDALGAASTDDDITWWRNDGSESFTKIAIDENFNGAHSVYAADVDGDGDMDVLGAADIADDIAWYENDGSEGFTKTEVDYTFNGAISVYAADIDGDGNMDVLGAAYDAADITWWENGNTPTATASFADGSSFTPSVTLGSANQAIGRFQLTSTANFGFVAAEIKLNGTRTGLSNFKLWQSSDNSFSSSSDIQLGTLVQSDPGAGKTIYFSEFVSQITTSGIYYFLTCDMASDGTGEVQGVLVNNAKLELSGGTLSSTISNGVLSNDDVPLPATLTSFTVSLYNVTPKLQWITQSESNNLGWNVYRSPSRNLGQMILLTTELIAGAGSVSEPTDYSFYDPMSIEGGRTYFYWIESISYSGQTELFGPVELVVPQGIENNGAPEIPQNYGLYQNYPNPFNPDSEIKFAIEYDSFAELTVYNAKGEMVITLFKDNIFADIVNTVSWNGKDENGKLVSSGIYLYKLRTEKNNYVKKMIFLK